MPSKSEYERIFNELLGVDIKWSKLSKHELAQLAILFNNPELLAKRLGLKLSEDKIKGTLVDILLDITDEVEGGPIIKGIRKLLGREK